jgi:hypothetical protein
MKHARRITMKKKKTLALLICITLIPAVLGFTVGAEEKFDRKKAHEKCLGYVERMKDELNVLAGMHGCMGGAKLRHDLEQKELKNEKLDK